MTTRKVQNPNSKGNTAFLWAVIAVLAIAALVIGLIVNNGRNNQKAAAEAEMVKMDGINVTWNEGEDTIHLAGANPKADANEGDLFEDFSCSYCAKYHIATDADMLELVKDGDITMNLRMMVGQDRGTVGHSTKSTAAFLALLAHGDVDAAFTLRNYLYENQQQVYNNVDETKLADLAKSYGASNAALQDIRDAKYIDAAMKMSGDNAKLQQDTSGEAWTPRVLIDGEDLYADGNLTETWPADLAAR
ncbi:thioredoxin domain-containing protein [Corynebacterium aquatimens]|uniref:DsbA family protein n=1 Tax=Corynebacterium TaxID=1716 RepID=UPI001F33226D|nr:MULTISPECIES: thioredoxin domain-containing protein [Corynebacterium]QYH19290.1 thioredoxin domain-containing protein [Corynebacterium aquatimens]UIZ91815.1 thioredoxin domain-containing protein [Corynebacterium sp. CNCTC7651]